VEPEERVDHSAHAMRESQMGIGSLEIPVCSKRMDGVLEVSDTQRVYRHDAVSGADVCGVWVEGKIEGGRCRLRRM
jgi:hypothetical protein